tara:strand:+ start:377 stop:616 length:240 start_codon:yes stop_codon:yes gene_type:complete
MEMQNKTFASTFVSFQMPNKLILANTNILTSIALQFYPKFLALNTSVYVWYSVDSRGFYSKEMPSWFTLLNLVNPTPQF